MATVETIFGRIDELTTPEILNLSVGVGFDVFGHIVGENFFDGYFKDKYPDNYFIYSTAATSGVMAVVAGILYFLSRRPGNEWLQYIMGGIILGEVVQLLDLIRVQLGLRGE